MPTAEKNDCAEKCHNDSSPFVDPSKAFDFRERAALGVHKVSQPRMQKISMPFTL